MRKGAAGQAPPQPWSSLRIRVRRLLSLTELRVRDGAGNGAAGGGGRAVRAWLGLEIGASSPSFLKDP